MSFERRSKFTVARWTGLVQSRITWSIKKLQERVAPSSIKSSSSLRHCKTRLSIAQLCGLRPLQLLSWISVRRTHFGGGPKHRGMTPTWSRYGAADRVAKAAGDGSRKTFPAPSAFLFASGDACGHCRRDCWYQPILIAVCAAANVDAKLVSFFHRWI